MTIKGVRHFPRKSVTAARAGSPNRTCDFPVVMMVTQNNIRLLSDDFNDASKTALECASRKSDGPLLVPGAESAPTGFKYASNLILARDGRCDMTLAAAPNRPYPFS